MTEWIQIIALGTAAGVLATLTMDILGKISQKSGVTQGVEGAWVGRWFLHVLRGKLIHTNVANLPQEPNEPLAAFVGHYAIGFGLLGLNAPKGIKPVATNTVNHLAFGNLRKKKKYTWTAPLMKWEFSMAENVKNRLGRLQKSLT